MTFRYKIHYGETGTLSFVTWKETCEMLHRMLKNGWKIVKVEKL